MVSCTECLNKDLNIRIHHRPYYPSGLLALVVTFLAIIISITQQYNEASLRGKVFVNSKEDVRVESCMRSEVIHRATFETHRCCELQIVDDLTKYI